MINSFSGQYEFLSNFYVCDIEFSGEVYRTLEHAYQAAKTLDKDERWLIQSASTPGRAKKLGKAITMRPDWDDIKIEVMTKLLYQKFETHGALEVLLLATGEEELVEGNWWNDTFWGVCKGVGLNHLGRLLMMIREDLRNRK